MSYSRWGNSLWYTYHDVASGKTKESQVFTVCDVGKFTFTEIEADILGCVKKCCGPDIDPSHFWELVEYMACFMSDMETQFREIEDEQR